MEANSGDGPLHHGRYSSIPQAMQNVCQMPLEIRFNNANKESTRNIALDEEGINSSSRADRHTEVSPVIGEDVSSSQSESISRNSQECIELPRQTSANSQSSNHHELASTQSVNSSYSLSPHTSPQEIEPSTQRPQRWLPFYLRRPTFVVFTVLFGAMVVALEVLFAISQKYQGLTEGSSNPSYRYSWTYGPTAILTLIHAFWNRVDYDAKTAAPWLGNKKVYTDRDSLLLDYLDITPPEVIFKALRRRDWLVVASATISLLLTSLIVLSTGLFTLEQVEIIDDATPITLTSRFIENPKRLKTLSSLAAYSVEGLIQVNLSYPNGCSDRFAYQSFTSDLPGVTDLHAIVDGMFLGLTCDQANISDAQFFDTNDSDVYKYPTNLSLKYGDCHAAIPFNPSIVYINGDAALQSNESNIWAVLEQYFVDLFPIDGLAPGHCGSNDLDHKRLAFYSVKLHYNISAASGLVPFQVQTIDLQSSSIVCTPYYHLQLVDVVQSSTRVKSVSRREGAPLRKFPAIHAWDVFQGLSNPFDNRDANNFPVSYNKKPNMTIGENVFIVLGDCGDSCSQFLSSSNTTTFERLLKEYYSRYAAFRFQSLTEPVDIASIATARRTTNRLLVQPMDCQLMATMMVLAVIILTVLLLTAPGTMPRSMEPGSMLVTAALVEYSTVSILFRNLGEIDKTLKTMTNGQRHDRGPNSNPTTTQNLIYDELLMETNTTQEASNTAKFAACLELITPLVLKPISRVIIYTIILGLVVILEITLQKSVSTQGLAYVQDETYLHYIWNFLPATILSALALYISSVDSQTRLLTPYHFLSQTAPMRLSLDLDLLRPLLPIALYQELQTKSFTAFSTSMATIFSSMFTVSIGPLYKSQVVPSFTPVNIQTTSNFQMNLTFNKFPCIWGAAGYFGPLPDRPTCHPNSSSLISSLILESNLSYTPLAYENLVLPELSLQKKGNNSAAEIYENSSTPISVVVPALRPGLSCRLYSDSDITTMPFYNQRLCDGAFDWMISDGIAINITEESCAPSTSEDLPADYSGFPMNSVRTLSMNLPADGRFAAVLNNVSLSLPGYSSFMYIWGSISSMTNPPTISASVLGCNDTLEIVDVVMSFIGSQLQIDPSRPPQPVESTSRLAPTNISFDEGVPSSTTGVLLRYTLYAFLESLPPYGNDTIFDPFFEQLVTSRYSIPVSAIGDPSQAELVKDAIIFQHGIIAAQYYSKYFRTSVENALNGTTGSMKTVFPSLSSLPTNDTGVYAGTAVNPYAMRRLLQDPVSTRVIQSLLLVTLTLSLLGWIIGPRKAMLPQRPRSIASVLALLAGGDALEHMYKGGDGKWKTIEEVRSAFPEDCRFWMGWGPPGTVKEETEKRFGIWVMKDKSE
ncbi:hypothetical protein M434DRAFT_381807 [Hypoxylon sp. CO27-5]|nr:hypothetical protein M434DRAFT_381807 [Hypoxylon sp. CO27-5]